MYQQFDSPTGVRFLALIKEGKSFRESLRAPGHLVTKGVVSDSASRLRAFLVSVQAALEGFKQHMHLSRQKRRLQNHSWDGCAGSTFLKGDAWVPYFSVSYC